jgi:hypothetical protein
MTGYENTNKHLDIDRGLYEKQQNALKYQPQNFQSSFKE